MQFQFGERILQAAEKMGLSKKWSATIGLSIWRNRFLPRTPSRETGMTGLGFGCR
jgi:hypothetical protein